MNIGLSPCPEGSKEENPRGRASPLSPCWSATVLSSLQAEPQPLDQRVLAVHEQQSQQR